MTEEVKIKLTSAFGSQGFDELRKKLNDSRNELNAMARSVEKNSKEWKQYKEAVKEINRIMKLSDKDLKSYTDSIKAEQKAIQDAERQTDKLSKTTKSLGDRFVITAGDIAGAFSGIANTFSGLIESSNSLDISNRKLLATSKLTGTSFQFLKDTAEDARVNLGLTVKDSNDLTTALAKLGQKAGDTSKTKEAIQSLLDLGSAQGLTVDETLTAINQAILGIDEGTDKLFQKNPSVIYKEYADKIGTTAGKLTDQQKAQALLNETIEKGGRVQGEYNKYLDTFAGKQQLLAQRVETLKQKFGEVVSQALTPFINEILKADNITQTLAGTVLVLGSSFSSLITLVGSLRLALGSLSFLVVAKTAGLLALVGSLATIGGLIQDAISNPVNTVVAFERIKQLLNEITSTAKDTELAMQGVQSVDIPGLGGDTNNTGVTSNSGSNQTKKNIEEVLSSAEKLRREIDKLQKQLSIETPGTKPFQDLTFQIEDLNKQLAEATSNLGNFFDKIPNLEILSGFVQAVGKSVDIQGLLDKVNALQKANVIGGFGRDQQGGTDKATAELGFGAELKKAVTNVDTVGSGIISIMNTLQLGTNQFVNDLISGFQTAIEIIKAIQTVNSILSFIPGLASGGSMSGGQPYLVGERGAELVFPRAGGTVFNNSDTTKLLNRLAGSGGGGAVNVYINANMDGLTFLRNNFPKYQNFKKLSRVN